MIPDPPPPAEGEARRLIADTLRQVTRDQRPFGPRLRRQFLSLTGIAPLAWELHVDGATPTQALAWVEAGLTRAWLMPGVQDGYSYLPGTRELFVTPRRGSPATDYARLSAAPALGGGATVEVSQRLTRRTAAGYGSLTTVLVVAAAAAALTDTCPVTAVTVAVLVVLRVLLRQFRRDARVVLERVLKRAIARRGGGVV